LYVTMKDWTVYIDNSTNEKIINSWKERKIWSYRLVYGQMMLVRKFIKLHKLIYW
jgi:hypothetical protein